jgi:hypothetical protein
MTSSHRAQASGKTGALVLGVLLPMLAVAGAGHAADGRSAHHHPAAPTVSKVKPSSGGAAGGTKVTIKGHGLSGAKKVLFGSAKGSKLTKVSSSKLTVLAPAHAAGTVDVRVVTNHGKSKVTTKDRFTYTGSTGTSALTLGSYSGGDSQNRALTLYVAPGGGSLQDVSVPVVDLSCVPASNTDDKIQVASISIGADGSFSSTTQQTGVFGGHPATFTYVFSGHVTSPTGLSGQLRESVSDTDIPARDCTSNTQTWSVTRDSQPGQPTSPPPFGSYSGGDTQNRALTFYVSANGGSLQDVSVPVVDVSCLPASNSDDKIQIGSIPVNADGSFSSTTQQTGVWAGHPATFTYLFQGHVHGVNAAGNARLAGQLRESVSDTDTPARDCTSNDQSWLAARDSQPSQPGSPPPSGSYSGGDTQNRALTFYVSADGGSLQDVSVPVVDVSCLPASNTDDKIQIDSIPINTDGSFSSTTVQTGVWANHPATFTYFFRGNVHGVNAAGNGRLAGTLRESISDTDSPARDCTSNDQSWLAARDTQPGQPTSPPPSGSYTGGDTQNRALAFDIAAGGGAIQDVSVPVVDLACVPATNTDDLIQIASITINADGSFSSTTQQTGVFAGHPATFTYVFRGHVHGVNSTGLARLAGTLRENVSDTDITRDCTSNDQAWTAHHT